MEKTKINKVYIVGTITEVNTKTGVTSDGKEYISGKITVKSIFNDIENLIDVKLFSYKVTSKGAENKVYASFAKLDGMINKRVKLTCEFREDAMVKSDGTINKFNTISLKFINEAKSADIDCAKFDYSGFVLKGLYERKNKDEETIGYRIEVGQANYNDTNIQNIKFDVDKNDMNIVQAIESNYLAGDTVSFSGIITSTQRVETKTEEVAFGEPNIKTYVVSEKMYRITSGKETFNPEDPAAYTQAEIKKFVEAYKAADAARLEKAKTSNDSANSAAPVQNSTVSRMTRASSLI